MLGFRTVDHPRIAGAQIVEVLERGKVIGVVYPKGEKGLKLISAHIEDTDIDPQFAGEVVVDDGTSSIPPIPAITVRFNPRPFRISGDRIVRFPNDPRTS
jgi:hypothetical protein